MGARTAAVSRGVGAADERRGDGWGCVVHHGAPAAHHDGHQPSRCEPYRFTGATAPWLSSIHPINIRSGTLSPRANRATTHPSASAVLPAGDAQENFASAAGPLFGNLQLSTNPPSGLPSEAIRLLFFSFTSVSPSIGCW